MKKKMLIPIIAAAVVVAGVLAFTLKKPGKIDGFENAATTVKGIEIPEGTRIVALGEATHGNKEFQELKLEVFQTLVEKTNVRALILEGDFGGCAKANKYIQGGEGTAEEVTRELGYRIYRTDDMCALVQWMHDYNMTAPEDQKVRLYGMDIQRAMNAKQLIKDMYAVVDANKGVDYSDKSSRLKVSDGGTTYTNADGSAYNGWLDDDRKRYYFVDGKAVTGWQYIDGLKFYFYNNGVLCQNVDEIIGKQSSYLLKVNKTMNCLTVYAPDGSNGYVIPVMAMMTSVGDDTPIGTFHTPEKFRWHLMIDDSYTQWATRITQGFMMHTITYEKSDNMWMNNWGYNNLSVSRSHGCVRLIAKNAKWIYDNCAVGTAITIYEDSTSPSPFMIPDQVSISFAQRWDPTDPTVVLN